MTLGRSVRRGATAVVLALAGVVAPAAAASDGACAAAEDGPHAALVVDTGTSVSTYCVALDAASVSGTHLIELAGQQHGLDYAFGYGGGAVCRLDAVGVEGGDCFGAFPDFWGYWYGDGSGRWTWAPTGAASHDVVDGGVEGWSWGSGDSPQTHGAPPATTIDEVCAADDDPSPPPDGGSTGEGGDGTGGGGGQGGLGSQPGASGGAGTTGAAPGAPDPANDPAGGTDGATGPAEDLPNGPNGPTSGGVSGGTGIGGAAAAPTGSGEDEVRAAAADDGSGDVPRPGVAGAIVVIAALAIGGWWRMRRRPGGTR
jgi:hypothetical protein